MNKVTEGVIIGAVGATIISNMKKNNTVEQVEQEIERRRLALMDSAQLSAELLRQKKIEDNNNIFLFWAVAVIGCFFFPIIFIPVCIIGLFFIVPWLIAGIVGGLVGAVAIVSGYAITGTVICAASCWFMWKSDKEEPASTNNLVQPSKPMTPWVKWFIIITMVFLALFMLVSFGFIVYNV